MNWKTAYRDRISQYLELREVSPSMYRDATWQFRDMALGGDGGVITPWPDDWPEIAVRNGWGIKDPTIRQYYYPNAPDLFFNQVLYGLGEMTD